MPTFNRTPFDPAKPQTYDGTNQSTVPLTADQRTQHANGNTAFSAAHDDVAALESGKADQAALDAHTGAANPHSGSAAKASPATAGNVAQLDASGDLVDSAIPAAQVARLDTTHPAQTWTAAQRFPIDTNFEGSAYIFGASPQLVLADTDTAKPEARAAWYLADAALSVRALANSSEFIRQVISHSLEAGAAGGTWLQPSIGGFRGEGTLNCAGVYVDGVELTPGGSVTNPPTLKGELWGHDGATTVRIPAAGSNALVLASDTSEAAGVKWETSQFFSPTQAPGDLIERGPSGEDVRIPIGATDQVLTVDGGRPVWKASQSGGVTTFVGLSDTPNNYTAANGFLTRVNAGATALEYVDGTALFQTKPGSATDGVLARYKANGELEESGIASADVSAHLASTANPHSVMHAQTSPVADEHIAHSGVTITAGAGLIGGGDITAPLTLDVGAGEGISANANDISVEWAGAGGNFGTLTSVARSDHAHDGVYEPVGALRNVVEDTTPQLGGNLLTEGNSVTLTRVDSSFHGLLVAMTTRAGAALAYSPDGSSFDLADGAVAVEPGAAHLYGASAIVEGLTHTDTAGRQVYVSQGGVLYSVEAPEPGWSDPASDATSTPRAGALGAWQQLPNLTTTIAQDLTNDRLNIEATVWTVNGTTNRSGTVEIGYGIGAAEPTSGVPKFIPESFAGYVTLSLSPDLTETAGTDIGIWVRVTQESNPAFSSSLVFDGTTNNHAARIATPGASGGGSGDVAQGTGGATGEVAVWQDFAGKLVHGTGITATAVLRNDASATVGSAVGYAATTAAEAGPIYSPNPLTGQYAEIADTVTDIEPLAVDGAVSVSVPASHPGGLTLSGYVQVGSRPARAAVLELRKVGTTVLAVWV